MSFEHPLLSSRHGDTIVHFFDEHETLIHIHLTRNIPTDDARIAFVLHALARAQRSDGSDSARKQSILKVFRATIGRVSPAPNREMDRNAHVVALTVQLFGMRIFQLLGESYDEIIDQFSRQKLQHVYSEPILMSAFLAAYAECPRLKERMPYAESMWYRALHVFDFLLNSSAKRERLPFDFAELSSISGISPQLAAQATRSIAEMVDGGYANTGSSSGIANCIEHFLRVGDDARARNCLDALEGRVLARKNEFLSTELRQDLYADGLFREHDHTQYVCLDTNAHLLHAYLNSKERQQKV